MTSPKPLTREELTYVRDKWLGRSMRRTCVHSVDRGQHQVNFYGMAKKHTEGTPIGTGRTYWEALRDALDKLEKPNG